MSVEIELLARRNWCTVQYLMRTATFIKVPRAHVSSVPDLTPAEWAAGRGARGSVPIHTPIPSPFGELSS